METPEEARKRRMHAAGMAFGRASQFGEAAIMGGASRVMGCVLLAMFLVILLGTVAAVLLS